MLPAGRATTRDEARASGGKRSQVAHRSPWLIGSVEAGAAAELPPTEPTRIVQGAGVPIPTRTEASVRVRREATRCVGLGLLRGAWKEVPDVRVLGACLGHE